MKVITATQMRRATRPGFPHTVRMPSGITSLAARAQALALDILRGDDALLEHSARAARHAHDIARRIAPARASEVVAAAWLHDVGYASSVRRTGFHPLDGALFLMAAHWPERVIRLVAHHSLASLEAPFYGVGHHLSVIESVTGIEADILISADLAAGAGSPRPTVEARIDVMRQTETALGLVPSDVREARYASLLAAHARVVTLLS